MATFSIASLRAAFPRTLRSAFTENVPYKAAALFLSLVLWFVVERQTPRTQEERLDVRLVLRLDSNLVRTSPLPEIRASILVSSQEELLRLETMPPEIRRSFQSDVADSVTVRIEPRDVILPDGVRSEVIGVEPREFVVRFDSLMQKTVPVRSAIRLTAGEGIAIAGAPRFEPDSVNIVGRRQAVVRVNSVSTESTEFQIKDDTPFTVRLIAPIMGMDVIPIEVLVRVPIVRTQPQ